MPAIMLIVPTLQRGNVVLMLQRHLERAWQRLGQPRIHRKHLVALNKTGRWSVQGRVPTLERGNDRKLNNLVIRGPVPVRKRPPWLRIMAGPGSVACPSANSWGIGEQVSQFLNEGSSK